MGGNGKRSSRAGKPKLSDEQKQFQLRECLEKRCSNCHIIKSTAEFQKHHHGLCRRRSQCKLCRSKQRSEYFQNNKQAHYARHSARRAKLLSSVTDDATELAMIRKFYEQCPPGYHIDHIMPIVLGGRHEIANLQWLEASLNASKGGKHPDDWDDPRPIRCKA